MEAFHCNVKIFQADFRSKILPLQEAMKTFHSNTNFLHCHAPNIAAVLSVHKLQVAPVSQKNKFPENAVLVRQL